MAYLIPLGWVAFESLDSVFIVTKILIVDLKAFKCTASINKKT